MTKKSKIAFALFFIVSLSHLLGILVNHDILQNLTKPFLMLSLLVLYRVSLNKVNMLYVMALIFSFLGDVFLMDKTNYFILGIGAFLLTQILYILIISRQLVKISTKLKILGTLPFAGYFLVLITILYKYLGAYLYPVIIYGLTISAFGALSFLYFLQQKNRHSFYLVFGALFFISSDSMIAINKFYNSKPYYSFLVMVTYIVAQYLIFKFMIETAKIDDSN